MELRFGFLSRKEKTQKGVADMLRNIAIIHIKIREKNNIKNEKGNECQNLVDSGTSIKSLSTYENKKHIYLFLLKQFKDNNYGCFTTSHIYNFEQLTVKRYICFLYILS